MLALRAAGLPYTDNLPRAKPCHRDVREHENDVNNRTPTMGSGEMVFFMMIMMIVTKMLRILQVTVARYLKQAGNHMTLCLTRKGINRPAASRGPSVETAVTDSFA